MGTQQYYSRGDKALKNNVQTELETERDALDSGFQSIHDDLKAYKTIVAGDSPYDMSTDDPKVFYLDPEHGAITFNLLDPADAVESDLVWLKVVDPDFDVTIQSQGSANVEGSSSYVISASSANLEGLILKTDGSDWHIFARFA